MLHSAISSSQNISKPDLVFKNGKVLDVFNLTWFEEDIAVNEGRIVGIGKFDGKHEIDLQGKYLIPGFIDAHVHIESSLVTPIEFAKVMALHGVTTAITDPHEIVNVLGRKGLDFMLDRLDEIPMNIYVMLPSCVPCTNFEISGAKFTSADVAHYITNERVLGLAEVMDAQSVAAGSSDMVAKLETVTLANKVIDGHAAGLSPSDINIYAACNIKTDHECTSVEEALQRLRRGMYVQIREGSVSTDLAQILPLVSDRNARRFMFVTDDNHLEDLVHIGGIDNCVWKAINQGMSPEQAIQLATLNAAECYGLRKGAVAPGYDADVVVLSDLDRITIDSVFVGGKIIVENGELVSEEQWPAYESSTFDGVVNSVNATPIEVSDLKVIPDTNILQTIEIIPNSLVTRSVSNAYYRPTFVSDIDRDILKLVLMERHRGTNAKGIAAVKGTGIKRGAVASTIAHDSHNIIATGCTDADIALAINETISMQGGIVAVNEGKVIAKVPLPIAGLMSPLPYTEMERQLAYFNESLSELGFTGNFNLMLTLSFLALPVIPELKITHQGLYHVGKNMPINLWG